MKNTLVVIIASIGFALPADALDIKAITAKPTADNPQYDNKKAWPMLVGDEYFLKQKWPKARLLIWAHPGERQGRRGPKITPADPACWIDAAGGKPADSIPDMDTDVILPDSDKPYAIQAATGNSFTCRHLTIGRNAQFTSACWGCFSVFGNILVCPTGKLQPSTLKLAGNHDTFIRQDWPQDGKLKKMHDERLIAPFDPKATLKDQPWWHGRITVYMTHDKAKGKSTEVIGYVNTADEVGIKSGTFIVGRDSRFLSTGPAAMSVNRGAKVVIMDGAQCSHGQNQFVNRDWSVAGGAGVTGGSPDRPLRRDAYFGVGYRNWMNLPVPELKNRKKKPEQKTGPKTYYGYGGQNARISGDLIGYPAKGTDARLVVCWQRISAGGAGAWGRNDEAFKKVFPKIMPKISVSIGRASNFENVRFDDLHRGGIVVPNADVFKSWKNVTFGEGCLSKDPKELIREINPKKGLRQTPEKKYTTK